MAANFNKIILMGNLTRDPQLSYLPSNTPVVEIGMAVNRRFKRQDGQQGEQVLFVDCRAMGKQAEVINQYCRKGNPLMIEGRLELDQWQDKEGNKRSKHRVFIENFQLMGGGQSGPGGGQAGHADDSGDDAGGHYGGPQQGSGRGGYNAGGQSGPQGGHTMDADDIPF